MIPFGIVGIVADQFYLKGIRNKDLLALLVAKSVFPFEKEIVVGPAILYTQLQIVTPEAKEEIKSALSYDLYSVQLLSMYTQYQRFFKENYLTSFNLLKEISPNSKTTKGVVEAFTNQDTKNNRKD